MWRWAICIPRKSCAAGGLRFRGRLYAAWRAHEDELEKHVAAHIERHMETVLGMRQ